jgi:hypothetical protein
MFYTILSNIRVDSRGHQMVLDGLKRLFGIGSHSVGGKAEEERVNQIDDEIDSLEKEIQESLDYASTRNAEHEHEISVETVTKTDFARGGGVARADKIKTG